jgi:hypothetical protein
MTEAFFRWILLITLPIQLILAILQRRTVLRCRQSLNHSTETMLRQTELIEHQALIIEQLQRGGDLPVSPKADTSLSVEDVALLREMRIGI